MSYSPIKKSNSTLNSVSCSQKFSEESTAAFALRYIPRAVIRSLLHFQRTDTPFLKGPRAPATKEIFQDKLQVVKGSVPKDLNGVYVRTGPNPQFKPSGGYHWCVPKHAPWFDGEGMVHAVHFGQGQAKSYSNHWIRCKRFLAETAAGCNLFLRFGDQKGQLGYVIKSIFSLFGFLLLPFKTDLSTGQLGNTALVWHNGKLLALMEAGFPFLLRMCSGAVRSMCAYTFGGALEHEFSAHPKVDPKTGEMICFSYGQDKLKGVDGTVAFFTVSPSGVKGVSHAVDVQAPQMMHDFAITEHYAVFMDHAFIYDRKHLFKGNSIPYRTDMTRSSRLGLLKRSAPEQGVQWFDVPPFVAFHTSTAWEQGENVHAIICRYQGLSLANSPQNNPPAEPVRYTINVATGAVTATRLVQGFDFEYPVIPLHLLALPSKFSYYSGNLLSAQGTAVTMDVVAKVDHTADTDSGLVATIQLPEGTIGGEFVVVPKHAPSAAAKHPEDDAWLVGFCRHHKTLKSFCMVYDAQTMSSTPVAQVLMPQPVPMGFHGVFLHDEQLKLQSS